MKNKSKSKSLQLSARNTEKKKKLNRISKKKAKKDAKKQKNLARELLLSQIQETDEMSQEISEIQDQEDQMECDDISEETVTTDKLQCKLVAKMYQVLRFSDVIIQILDARNPMSGRCKSLEGCAEILQLPIVFVLNKSDLIPKANLKEWLTELRKEYPTVAVRSNIPMASKKLCHVPKPDLNDEQICTLPSIGYGVLMHNLCTYKQQKCIPGPLRVCVFGAPNVGKFTFMQSMKKQFECEYKENELGMKTVLLNGKIQMYCEPERLFASKQCSNYKDMMSPISFAEVSNPMEPIEYLISQIDLSKLQQHYKLPECNSASQFVFQLAEKKGKISPLGVPDEMAIANLVWSDWISGNIKHHSMPPKNNISPIAVEMLEKFGQHESNSIESKAINSIPSTKEKVSIVTPTGKPFLICHQNAATMETEEEKCQKRVIQRKKKNRHKVVVKFNKKPQWDAILKEVHVAKGLMHQLQATEQNEM